MIDQIMGRALYGIMQKFTNSKFAGMYTALPAKIISYNSVKKTCSAQPTIKKRYLSGDVVGLPIVHNVPVLFPQTAECIFSMPIKKNDEVLLVFCQRSLDEWKNKTNTVTPGDSRKFDINDAVAIPGLMRPGKGLVPEIDAVLLQHQNTKMKLFADGKMQFINNTAELISVLNEFLTELKNFAQEVSSITTIVMGAPTPPTNAAALLLYVAKFTIILNKLATFKK